MTASYTGTEGRQVPRAADVVERGADPAVQLRLHRALPSALGQAWADGGRPDPARERDLGRAARGDEIRGSGGFWKLGLSRRGSGKGKSGTYRVLYLYIQANDTVCLVDVFGKNEKANISKADTNGLAKIAVGLKAWAKERHEEWLRWIEEQ